MNSARVVTENCYGMLKSRWQILYKKAESNVFNLKYIIMACVMLHNFCIAKHDPCNPHWRLSVEELELNKTVIKRRANKIYSLELSENLQLSDVLRGYRKGTLAGVG